MVEATLLRVEEASAPMFCDGYISDEGALMFGSFWGNETILMEFFARLTLPSSEFGIRELNLTSESGERFRLVIPRSADLFRLSARTPATTILGAMCHVFVYDACLRKPNRTTGDAYVFGLQDQSREETMNRAWMQIQDLSQVPILDHWRDYLMPIFLEYDWVIEIESYGLTAFKISLTMELLEQIVTEGLKTGSLFLERNLKNTVKSEIKETLALF